MAQAAEAPGAGDGVVSERLDTIRKAFALAFAARGEEQRAAWLGVMRLCLREGWTSLDQMLQAFNHRAYVADATGEFFKPKQEWKDTPYGWDHVVPFGRHQGRSLGTVAKTDPAHIKQLMHMKLSNSYFKSSVISVYQWLQENPPDDA